MSRSAWLLAAVVAAVWAVLYLATQVALDPPMRADLLVALGVAMTVALILGFPSALRGPREPLGTSRGGMLLRAPPTVRGEQPASVAVFGGSCRCDPA